jgi:plasmid stabilization system protein ParE
MQLRVSEAAALAIIDQTNYYLQAADISVASRWESAVDEAIRSLLNQPQRGAQCSFGDAALSDLRWIMVRGFPRHMVFYRYLPAEQMILIVHVLHGARNLEALLEREE